MWSLECATNDATDNSRLTCSPRRLEWLAEHLTDPEFMNDREQHDRLIADNLELKERVAHLEARLKSPLRDRFLSELESMYRELGATLETLSDRKPPEGTPSWVRWATRDKYAGGMLFENEPTFVNRRWENTSGRFTHSPDWPPEFPHEPDRPRFLKVEA